MVSYIVVIFCLIYGGMMFFGSLYRWKWLVNYSKNTQYIKLFGEKWGRILAMAVGVIAILNAIYLLINPI